MNNTVESRFNKTVALLSVIAGLITWLGSHLIYRSYHDVISGPVMIGILCAGLFATVFITVYVGSMVSGSFDKKSQFYNDTGGMVRYFLFGLVGILILSMSLEYIYELNPKFKEIKPTSYIFVIDESGSMSSNDSAGLRYDAIPEIMEAEEAGFPYMVYTFSNETHIARNMGPLEAEYVPIPVKSNGGTAIYGTILQILEDYKEEIWDGGSNPKVIFLTDGVATDLSNGFLWFKGNMPEFNAALEEYKDLSINISTVGLGVVDREIMTKIAETTGGVFVSVQNSSDLVSAMKTAATSYSDRDLLSIRYMKHMDNLYAVLRILFLTIIGAAIGSLMLLAYMEDGSIPIIIFSSSICSLFSSILFEVGLKIGILQTLLWIILWGLFSLTIGYLYSNAKQLTDNPYVVRLGDDYMHTR